MEFARLLELVGDEPVFESSFLLAGEVDPAGLRLQLSRWVKSGKILQLRRGLYSLAPPYQKAKPHPFLVANRLVRASYVSLQSGLAFFGLIPEYVPITTSVTANRPGRRETPLGPFEYRHLKPEYLRGYRLTDLGNSQQAFVALPEKALLDLVYLQPKGDAPAYLKELRLQNLERLNPDELRRQARYINHPKLSRAVETILALAETESEEYESL
jgi:predicted transcriptional regulator of viral defense system